MALEPDEPPAKPLQVVATDAAGNRASEKVRFAVVRSRAVVDQIRGVHVSLYGWASSLRKPVLKMADRRQITTVQLDLKDESGVVGYDSKVPLAKRAGAVNPINDLPEAVDELHGGYGGFTNFSHPDVQQNNIDIAKGRPPPMSTRFCTTASGGRTGRCATSRSRT